MFLTGSFAIWTSPRHGGIFVIMNQRPRGPIPPLHFNWERPPRRQSVRSTPFLDAVLRAVSVTAQLTGKIIVWSCIAAWRLCVVITPVIWTLLVMFLRGAVVMPIMLLKWMF